MQQLNIRKRVDLTGLQALCALNYQRLLKVMPQLLLPGHQARACDENVNSAAELLDQAELWWGVGEQADRLLVHVTQRCPYTTMVELTQPQHQALWLPGIVMQLRIYHDAGLAEVTGYQKQRHIRASYSWPNEKMLQPDEKIQQNRLLGEWLELCLQHGWCSEQIS